jgi:steroid 5-alpha reductase family enzyme
MTIALLLILIAIFLSVAMAAVWVVAQQEGKSGWTDAVWSFATGAAGAIAALVPIGGPPSPRQWMVALLVGLWGARLGGHIAQRTAAHPHDDPRYAELRRIWGARWPRQLFRFLQIQALAGWILAASALLAARNTALFPAWSDYAGVAIALVALIGEALADSQLRRFRATPENAGKVCTVGLWSLTRHPNYFFEWLGWVAIAVIAIGPIGTPVAQWLALAGPALMYWLLVHASGIPPLEAHMLRSRGEAYRDVQRRISAFWPMPPKA